MLPLRDAARAACLSHAFLHFWRCHPILILNRDVLGSNANACQENFSCIIDHILRKHLGGVKKLKIQIDSDYSAKDSRYLNNWLQTAVTPGIEELTLELCHRGKINYNISCSLLSDGVRNSIRHLQLGFLFLSPHSWTWPPYKPNKSGLMFCAYFGGRVGVLSFQVSCFGAVETP